MTSVNLEGHLEALEKSMQGIEFGEVLLITDEYSLYNKENLVIPRGVELAPIDPITSINQWCHDVIYKLPKYIKTDYMMLVHADGYIINPDLWNPDWLNYDYVGAPWPEPAPWDEVSYRDPNGKIIRVGNSVSLRSKKLLDLPNKLNLPWMSYYGYYNEDGFLCCHNHLILEEYGCKFAPFEVALHFSLETPLPENKNLRTFAFHTPG